MVDAQPAWRYPQFDASLDHLFWQQCQSKEIPMSKQFNTDPESDKLRRAFDSVCREIGVYHGDGPPMVYFDTKGDDPKRYFYVAGGFKGGDFEKVLDKSVAFFREWTKPNRSLIWRHRPEVYMEDYVWSSYWRCVQLDGDVRSMIVEWNF